MKAILLVNLGTPLSPRLCDVRRYLNEFLTDRRVIELPSFIRQLLVRGLIVPRRVKESASIYQKVWTEEGSPLMVHSQRAAAALQRALGGAYRVFLAMRYQEPSIETVLASMRGYEEITILPLFPQYASATTGSVQAKVMEIVSQWEVIPTMRFIRSYPTQPSMIQAFAARGREMNCSAFDEVIMSFHGLPEEADHDALYSTECKKTAEALAQALQLPRYHLSYQSRLGNKPWLKPYTTDLIAAYPGKRLLIFCPSFVADCLETLVEIGIEYAHLGDVTLVPSLNDHPQWIQGLVELAH